MSDQDLLGLIVDVLQGRCERVHELAKVPHDELARLADERAFTLTGDAVARVLRVYRDGEVDKPTAQQWASFVSSGYLAPATGPAIDPIDIEWEEPKERAIAEALMRLDELGDIVDGDLRPGEADQLLAALR